MEQTERRPRAQHTSPKNGMKRCAKCGETKPVGEFTVKLRGSGVAPYCKPCKVKINREFRAKQQARPDDPTAQARFWIKVEKTDTCWLWRGGVGYLGYGRFLYRGRLEQAHRVSLILAGVAVPDRWETGLVVDHMCRNSACVRPDHLQIVTHGENANILAVRDRAKQGENQRAAWARRRAAK